MNFYVFRKSTYSPPHKPGKQLRSLSLCKDSLYSPLKQMKFRLCDEWVMCWYRLHLLATPINSSNNLATNSSTHNLFSVSAKPCHIPLGISQRRRPRRCSDLLISFPCLLIEKAIRCVYWYLGNCPFLGKFRVYLGTYFYGWSGRSLTLLQTILHTIIQLPLD